MMSDSYFDMLFIHGNAIMYAFGMLSPWVVMNSTLAPDPCYVWDPSNYRVHWFDSSTTRMLSSKKSIVRGLWSSIGVSSNFYAIICPSISFLSTYSILNSLSNMTHLAILLVRFVFAKRYFKGSTFDISFIYLISM